MAEADWSAWAKRPLEWVAVLVLMPCHSPSRPGWRKLLEAVLPRADDEAAAWSDPELRKLCAALWRDFAGPLEKLGRVRGEGIQAEERGGGRCRNCEAREALGCFPSVKATNWIMPRSDSKSRCPRRRHCFELFRSEGRKASDATCLGAVWG